MIKWVPVAAVIIASMVFLECGFLKPYSMILRADANPVPDPRVDIVEASDSGNNEAPPRPIGTKRIGSIEVSRDIAFQVAASVSTI